MNWPAYPEYKESGVEYLDQLPAHWTLSKFSRHIAINSGQVDPRDEPFRNMPLIAPNHIESETGQLFALESAEEQGADSGKYVVREGQLIYSKIRPNLAKAVIAPVDCLCSADMYGLTPDPRKLVSEFTLRVLLSKPFTEYVVDSSMRVAMPKVNHDSLGAAPIWYPPLSEQRAIVDFLDREIAKIDALIGKQEQLIATLREDRTATITHAVTKGLDTAAEMQDSGVEWLGTVPAHWRQTQLRHLLSRIEQGVSPQAYGELADDGWGVLKSGCVNSGIFADVQHKKLPDDFEIDPAIVVNERDLLVCRASGSADLVGSTAIVRQLRYQLILSDKTFRLVPGTLALPDYLEWAMNSRMYREQVGGAISGAEGLANNLPMSALKTFRFPVPPLEEQEQISAYLSERSETIDALIAKANQVMATLREYRSALITDAVTGKIDVRGAA